MTTRTWIRTLLMFSVAAGICPLSANAQDYPSPYPRSGARKLLENDRVIVWDVTWPKNVPTAMHEHRFEQLSVTLMGGVVKVTKLAAEPVVNTSTVGSINLVEPGTVHVEEGLSDVSQRKIMVEIKPWTSKPEPVRRDAPSAFPREGAIKLRENDRIAVWDYTWIPGRPVPRHYDAHDSVTVFLDSGTIRTVGDDRGSRERIVEPGRVIYSEMDLEPYTEEATDGSPRAIVIELK